MEKLYCSRCDLMVVTEVKTVAETYSLRGEEITISAEVTFCQSCGEQIFDEELDSRNLEKIYMEFRERKGIITPEKIRGIRQQYGLSQCALGRLLKLGEITINRYENGSLPSDAHNELLILIKNPANVRTLLDEVGSDLSSSEEQDLRKRLDDLLRGNVKRVYVDSALALLGDYKPSIFSGFRDFDPIKTREMVTYATSEIHEPSKTKLMKILFYSDFLHFKANGVSLSGMRYANLPFGPAVDRWSTLLAWLEGEGTIELVLTEQGWDLIIPRKRLQSSVFQRCELNTLENVVGKLGPLTARELSEWSHLEKAYPETKNGELISYEYALELNFN